MIGIFPRAVVLTTLVAWGSRLFAAAAQLIAFPVLLANLGEQDYAAYAVVIGLAPWVALCDFGAGASLQNRISQARVEQQPYGLDILVAGVFTAAAGLAVLLALGAAATDLGDLLFGKFGVRPSERPAIVLISGAFMILAAVGGLMTRIWYAEQRGYVAQTCAIAATALMLLMVIGILPSLQSGRISFGVAASVGPAAVIGCIALILRLAKGNTAKTQWMPVTWSLLRQSFGFWSFGLMASAVLAVDYLVMSQILSAKEIVRYALLSRIFSVVFLFYGAVLTAVWPTFSEEIARNEWPAVLRRIRLLVAGGILMLGVATLLVVGLSPQIVRLLGGGVVDALPVGLILAFAGYWALRIWADTFATVLQSANHFRSFWILVPLQAAIGLAAQIALGQALGATGIVLGLGLSFGLTVCWGLPLAVRRLAANAAHRAPGS